MTFERESLKPYAKIRVRQLLQSADDYNGWHVNERPPQVGDTGTLIDVLTAPGLPDKYIVESVTPDGATTWHAAFYAEELEFIQFLF